MNEGRSHFADDGFVILRGLLTSDECEFYRSRIQILSGLDDGDYGAEVFASPDAVSKHREFWPLITHPRLIEAVREILGPTARYTQHSDIHVHRGSSGWHRDSACREYGTGADWDESEAPYGIVRVAIYLQTYAESGARLGVVPGSQRYESRLSKREQRYWNLVRRGARTVGWSSLERRLSKEGCQWIRTGGRGVAYVTPPARVEWIATEPGDCLIFSQRILHCSTDIRGPKYAMFLSYGMDNVHSRNHMAYYRHFRKDLNYGALDPELAERLKAEGLFLDAPAESGAAGFTQVASAT